MLEKTQGKREKEKYGLVLQDVYLNLKHSLTIHKPICTSSPPPPPHTHILKHATWSFEEGLHCAEAQLSYVI